MIPVFENDRERFMTESYRPMSLCFVATKIFDKLVNKRRFGHLERHGLFWISCIVSGLLISLNIFSFHFSVTDGLKSFWVENLNWSVLLMLVFFKAPFIV